MDRCRVRQYIVQRSNQRDLKERLMPDLHHQITAKLRQSSQDSKRRSTHSHQTSDVAHFHQPFLGDLQSHSDSILSATSILPTQT